jgi:hypothetical protein
MALLSKEEKAGSDMQDSLVAVQINPCQWFLVVDTRCLQGNKPRSNHCKQCRPRKLLDAQQQEPESAKLTVRLMYICSSGSQRKRHTWTRLQYPFSSMRVRTHRAEVGASPTRVRRGSRPTAGLAHVEKHFSTWASGL